MAEPTMHLQVQLKFVISFYLNKFDSSVKISKRLLSSYMAITCNYYSTALTLLWTVCSRNSNVKLLVYKHMAVFRMPKTSQA